MFNFPELQTRNELGLRFYETPDKQLYPSITSILGKTSPPEKVAKLTNWQNSLGKVEAARVGKAAADRGTSVHLLIERYLKDEPLQKEEFSPEDFSYFNALKLKLKNVTEVWGQEIPLYSDLLEIAGRCDLIGAYKGLPSIVDYKTSTRIKSVKDIEDYKLQCAFYGVACNEKHGTDINQGVILMTSAGGFPQEFIFPLAPEVPRLVKRIDEFYATYL